MNQKQLIEVVSKSFGLYFIIEVFLNIKQLVFYGFGFAAYGDDNFSLYFYLGQNISDTIIYSIGAWLFIVKSEFVSNKVANIKPDEIQLTVSKSDLIEIVIIAIGVLSIVSSIPEILNKLTAYLYFNEFGRADKNLYWNENSRKADILFSVFKLAIGFVTILNGRLIAKKITCIGDKDETN